MIDFAPGLAVAEKGSTDFELEAMKCRGGVRRNRKYLPYPYCFLLTAH
jgi:hypothetical protein